MNHNFTTPHLNKPGLVHFPVGHDEDSVTVRLYSNCAETLEKTSRDPHRMAVRLHARLLTAKTAEEFNEIARKWHGGE